MSRSKEKKKKKSSWPKALLTGALIGCVGIALAYLTSLIPFSTRVELMSLDLRYKTRKPIDLYPNLGYVNLDTESCELAGDWPWARSYHVALVETLGFYGAKAAGYDVFYTEPSPINKRPAPKITENMDDETRGQALLDMFVVHDDRFREALETSGVIYLGEFLTSPEQVGLGKGASDEDIRNYIEAKKETPQYTDRYPSLQQAQKDAFPVPPAWKDLMERTIDIAVPIKSLSEVSQGVGFEQIIPDNITGTVYEYPMLLEYDGYVYPALGLLMAADIMGMDLSKGRLVPGEYLELEVTKPHGEIEVGPLRIPVNEKMRMLMNWSGPYFETYFHVNFRQLSTYYGALKVKEMLRELDPTQGIGTSERERLLAKTKLEKWVEPEEAEHLVGILIGAWWLEPRLEKSDTELLEGLGALTELSAKENREVLEAIRLAHHVLSEATPEDLDYVQKNISQHDHMDFRPTLFSPDDYPSLELNHTKEIVRNVLYFASQGEEELTSVAPLYFPPCLKSHVYGSVREISPTMLKDKVLMIGLEGEGTIDLNPQPYEESCAMVALHANAINTFLTNQYLHFPDWSHTWTVVVILSLTIAIFAQLLSSRSSFFVFLALLATFSYYCWSAFSSEGWHFHYVVPVVGLTLSYLCSVGLQLYIAFREKQKMKGMFGKMVSPDVLQVMSDNPDLFSLSGRRMSCTSYFSSMEGFAHISKGVTPQELTGLLGSYLTPASQIVTSYKGYIDKYEGHIIMADYGVPIPTGDHRLQCLYASIEQQLDITAFRHFIYARKGKEVNTSMGVNTGFVSAGNMGSDKKMQYTIMGDTVNTAARFRPANWIYDNLGSIIIGESTYPLVKDFIQVRPLDRLLLKGKLKPVNIYQVMGWDPETYLSMRKDHDPTETLMVCWAQHCPPEKIYGYQLMWKAQFERTGHSMCQEISDFFASHIEDSAELTRLTLMGEVRDNAINYRELNERYQEIAGDGLVDIPSGKWAEKISKWQTGLRASIHRLEEEFKGNPEADKLHRDLLDVEEKLEVLEERLGMELDLPQPLKETWKKMRDYVSSEFQNDTTDFGEAYSQQYSAYEGEATTFVHKICSRRGEYHAMMSLAGSMTDREKNGIKTYTEALRLHWERDWEGSFAMFEKVLGDLPKDKPARVFMERVKAYEEKPPGSDWQGEFKQTKK